MNISARQRTKTVLAVFAIAFVAMLGTGFQASASTPAEVRMAAMGTEDAPRPDQANGQDLEAAACSVVAKTAVKIRRSASTGSDALGQLNAGQSAAASCNATSGGSYTACGGTSKWWIYVTRGTTKGYVAWRCVNWHTSV